MYNSTTIGHGLGQTNSSAILAWGLGSWIIGGFIAYALFLEFTAMITRELNKQILLSTREDLEGTINGEPI